MLYEARGDKGHFTHESGCLWPLHFKHYCWWKRRSWSKFASHYAWRANGVCECKMGVKSTWNPTWHHMDHVSWSLRLFSRTHLLEIGPTQNLETMAFRTLTTIDLFYFILCEDLHEQKFIEITFGWGPGHIWLHTPLEDPWPHYMIFNVSWDSLGTLSFGLSQFHGHGSWLVCGLPFNPTQIAGPAAQPAPVGRRTHWDSGTTMCTRITGPGQAHSYLGR